MPVSNYDWGDIDVRQGDNSRSREADIDAPEYIGVSPEGNKFENSSNNELITRSIDLALAANPDLTFEQFMRQQVQDSGQSPIAVASAFGLNADNQKAVSQMITPPPTYEDGPNTPRTNPNFVPAPFTPEPTGSMSDSGITAPGRDFGRESFTPQDYSQNTTPVGTLEDAYAATREWRKDNPVADTALSTLIPAYGAANSIEGAAQNLQQGNYGQAALNVAQMVPGVGGAVRIGGAIWDALGGKP